jgi:hypothetical protein
MDEGKLRNSDVMCCGDRLIRLPACRMKLWREKNELLKWWHSKTILHVFHLESVGMITICNLYLVPYTSYLIPRTLYLEVIVQGYYIDIDKMRVSKMKTYINLWMMLPKSWKYKIPFKDLKWRTKVESIDSVAKEKNCYLYG